MTDTLAAALAWHDAGVAVLPTKTDGSKAPAVVSWTGYQRERPTRAQAEAWFSSGHPGVGVVTGAVSGNLEMVELEGRAVAEGALQEVTALLSAAGLADLWVRITAEGYAEKTPSGGLHLLYRVAGAVPGNTKLANRPAHGDELTDTERDLAAKGRAIVRGLAETRGEGGYVVIAPSHGPTHASGLPWAVAYGRAGVVPTLTADEREQLLRVFRCLDQMPAPEAQTEAPRLQVVRDGDSRPGDDYEDRTTWQDILEPHGWKALWTRGGRTYWRRPGKDTTGISATTGGAADGRDRLYVFSSSTEFPTEEPITKFRAYAILEHGGQNANAARDLRKLGFGTPAPLSPSPAAEQAAAIADLIPERTAAPTTNQRALHAVDGTAARVLAEPPPQAAKFGPTQDGMARALVANHGGTLRYCPQRGRWLQWTGHRWLWDDAEHHRELIRTLARDLPDDDGWRRFKASALSANGVTGVARLAQSDAAITVHLADLDARPYEINTPTGIIDLRTGVLSDPDPDALHTRCTAVAPDFDRRSEVFERFLADTFEPDLIAFVQRLIGLSAIGTVLEQMLPFAHGVGANGKSTLLEAAMHVLGFGETGYAMAAPAEMLMVRRHAEHPAELAQLAGARLVVCSELDDGQRFAEARVKQLTGRDSINARFMRRDPFTFVPSHTLWLLGNHKPAARTGGPAFWRRVRLIPFTRTVPDEKRDPALGEKLVEDAAAILAWIALGAAEYNKDGLREPAIVRAATDAYQADQETVPRFIEEQCHLAPGSAQVRVWRDDLRTAYERWCHENGDEEVSAKAFGGMIRDLCGDDGKGKTGGRRYWTGICLLQPEEDEDDVPHGRSDVPRGPGW